MTQGEGERATEEATDLVPQHVPSGELQPPTLPAFSPVFNPHPLHEVTEAARDGRDEEGGGAKLCASRAATDSADGAGRSESTDGGA